MRACWDESLHRGRVNRTPAAPSGSRAGRSLRWGLLGILPSEEGAAETVGESLLQRLSSGVLRVAGESAALFLPAVGFAALNSSGAQAFPEFLGAAPQGRLKYEMLRCRN